jgi:transposase-like protein
MTDARVFRGFRFPAEVILWTVRWCLQFPVSYRDLERMLADRGVAADHTTMYRWVERFAPECESASSRDPRAMTPNSLDSRAILAPWYVTVGRRW